MMPDIKMLIMDVDGTLTDGKINISENGELFKSFNVKDGMGIKIMHEEYGLIPVIITSRKSKITEYRAKELGIIELHQNVINKKEKMIEIAKKYKIDLKQIAYIGDDVNDIEAMSYVGMSFSPNDAVSYVKEASQYQLQKDGGNGAVRECIDILISIKTLTR